MSTNDATPDNSAGSMFEWTETSAQEENEALAALLNSIEDLEDRVTALEGLFSSRVVDKEQAHTKAVKQDARDQLSVGETRTVVIEEARGTSKSKSVTRIDGIVTFVCGDDSTEAGDTVDIKLTDVQDTYAHAIAVN